MTFPYTYPPLQEIPNNLPPRPNQKDFTDRAQQIKELIEYLGRSWRVVITGLGGVGKTTLALESVYKLTEIQTFDAIIWTSAKQYELRAANTRFRSPYLYQKEDMEEKMELGVWVESFDDFLLKILEVSKHPNYEHFLLDEAPLLNEVIGWLEMKQTILIIDDLDSWEDWTTYLEFIKLLPDSCRVIITSRQVFDPAFLPGMALIKLKGLTDEDSKQYLDKLLYKKGIQLDSSEYDFLIQYADGNPLIIGLTVSLLENKYRQFSLQNMLGLKPSIRDLMKGLTSSQSGEFLIRDVYDSLSDAATNTLILLASVNNSLLAPVSSNQLLPFSGLTSSELLTSLRELENSSLISHDANNPNQYVMNKLVRDIIVQENRAVAKQIDNRIRFQKS